MSSEPEITNEAENNVTIEEAPKDTPIETTPEEPIKNEAKQQENANEEPQFKNKTERLRNKKGKCNRCNAEMTLKTMRYSHNCNGKAEDKAVKPKPRQAKPKAVAIQPPINNEVITNEEPLYMQQVKHK